MCSGIAKKNLLTVVLDDKHGSFFSIFYCLFPNKIKNSVKNFELTNLKKKNLIFKLYVLSYFNLSAQKTLNLNLF